jgi:hypothetical protein
MTPNLAVVHIHNPHWRGFKFWIPLFLLWIPAILLSPLIFIILSGLCIAGEVNPWRAIRVFWDFLCSLPGTHIHVRADQNQVLVRIL